MDREILVSLDLHGAVAFVGRLWCRTRRGRHSASFEYDPGWLAHPERFALEPALMLAPGPFHTAPGRSLFGAVGDSMPDRWGRLLMRRAERRRARQEGRAPRALSEADVLLLVDDEARQGALRLAWAPRAGTSTGWRPRSSMTTSTPHSASDSGNFAGSDPARLRRP